MSKKKIEKAVVLKYLKSLKAPYLVCKGKNQMAKRIKKIAREHNVEIIDKKDLAERLYVFEAGDFIPEDLYEITAEVLAFVYNLQKR